jgi:hypothetical protein
MQDRLGAAFAQFDAIPEHGDYGQLADELVLPTEALTARERADIYREQYWLRHRDALYEDYPALSHFLAEEGFEQLCRDYLTAHPPQSFTLRDLGNDMATFAASYDGFEPERAAAARDLARFELAFVDLFDGPDVPHADPESLSGLPPEAWAKARIVLHPGLVLLALGHPVHSYRTRVRAEGSDPERELCAEPTWLAMYRSSDLKVRYLPLEQRQYQLLDAMRQGATLLDACDALAEATPEAEQAALAGTLRGWFQGWGRRGWIVDVR